MPQDSNAKAIHSEHSTYLTQIKEIKFDTFFSLLEEIDPQKRDEILSLVYSNMFEPKTIIFTTPVLTVPRGMAKYSYKLFKQRCFTLSKTLSGTFLVHSIVSYTLQTLYHFDGQSAAEKQYYSSIALVGRDIRIMLNKEHNNDEQSKTVEIDEDRWRMLVLLDQQQLEAMLLTVEDILNETKLVNNENNNTHYYELYQYFCQEVVATLNR